MLKTKMDKLRDIWAEVLREFDVINLYDEDMAEEHLNLLNDILEIQGKYEKILKAIHFPMTPIDEDDYVITIEEFIENVDEHFFMDDDGCGVLATNTQKSDYYIYPSEFNWEELKKDKNFKHFTHVVWYNK